ncbi:MAG: hypothetical protein LBQ24_03245 [Candidatus Peribacteria bacterium]|jgi:hypothetical protein|nr:hypothetical protein [Candidatus Peribacteria bacterium]
MIFQSFKAFMAFGLLNLSITQSIQKEFIVFTSIFFLVNTSASTIEFMFMASIHILSALALSIFNIDISAHLTKFHHQTTIQISTFSFTKVFITSQILSTTSKSNQNHFSQAKASQDIFKSILIIFY